MTGDVLEFAKSVENQAAYTYAAALTLLTDPAYAAATSTILPIEAQHATVLALALGEGPDEWFPTGAFESAALGDGTDPPRPASTPPSSPEPRRTNTRGHDNTWI